MTERKKRGAGRDPRFTPDFGYWAIANDLPQMFYEEISYCQDSTPAVWYWFRRFNPKKAGILAILPYENSWKQAVMVG